MRVAVSFLAVAAVVLVGCGKSQDSNGGGGEPASAPAAATAAQAKAIEATLPAPYNTGDLANGEEKFAQCRACHTPDQGGPNMTGPNLWGVFGRKAGSISGFNYSNGLKSSGITWDAAQIDKWITNPHAVVPDTRMSFPGISDAKDRADVVAYLKTVTTAPPP